MGAKDLYKKYKIQSSLQKFLYILVRHGHKNSCKYDFSLLLSETLGVLCKWVSPWEWGKKCKLNPPWKVHSEFPNHRNIWEMWSLWNRNAVSKTMKHLLFVLSAFLNNASSPGQGTSGCKLFSILKRKFLLIQTSQYSFGYYFSVFLLLDFWFAFQRILMFSDNTFCYIPFVIVK